MAEFFAFNAVAILFVLMVVAPLVGRVLEVGLNLPSAPRLPPPAPAGAPILLLPAPGATPRRAPRGEAQAAGPPAPEDEAEAPLIDVAGVEGRVRASALKRVEEIVGNHPDEALAILRNWLGYNHT